MRKLISALIFIICPVIGNTSDDWFYMGKTNESKYYINIPSISEFNEYGSKLVKSWIKEEIYNDITKDGLTVGDHTMFLYQLDCKNNKIGLKSMTSYKGNKPFGIPTNKSYVEMRDVIPESIGQSILAYSCEGLRIKNTNSGSY